MQQIQEDINKFVGSVISTGDIISKFVSDISRKEEDIENQIKNLENLLKSKIINISNEGKISSDLKSSFDNTTQIYTKMIENFKENIIQTKKGMKFIEDFEKHFIITVFGKVKCGKSSLGNYIMGNSIRKSDIKTMYDDITPPQVNIYDRGKLYHQDKLNELEDGEGFGVKSTEATSMIQWFYMGGIAWFDTPGIGSITKENEELAKEYVKNSDLIIFITNSDAAGTRQEFEELKELIGMQKPVLLLVTMSDTYDEVVDKDENIVKKLIAKSETDRKDVQDYLIQTLKENGLEEVLKLSEILTISTKLASESVKDCDDFSFKTSNMSKFYEKIVSITNEKAVEFKKSNPKKRINKLIDDIINDENSSIESIKKVFIDILKNIRDKKENIYNIKPLILDRVKAESTVVITSDMAKLKSRVENSKDNISSQEITDMVFKNVSSIFSKVSAEEISVYLENFDEKNYKIGSINGLEVSDMKMKKDSIAYKFTEVYQKERDPRGLEHIPAFFGKKYYKPVKNTRTMYHDIDIGVNDNEIISSILVQFDNVLGKEVDSNIKRIVDDYFTKLEKIVDDFLKNLDDVKGNLISMRL